MTLCYRLQDDIRGDPWFNLRTKKYMSGPKRHPFKNQAELKSQYREQWIQYFFFGALMAWPVAVMVGKRMQTYQGGVPVVPYQRWVHDFPNVHASRTTWRFFRRYGLGTMFLAGFVFARKMTDTTPLNNRWYTRPDLKPKAAMVKDNTAYDDVAYKQMLESAYIKHKKTDTLKRSSIYRLLFPNHADFTPKENLWVGRELHNNYNPATGEFPTLNHDYNDHRY